MHLYEQELETESLKKLKVKIYSIGPQNELHGPALHRNIDEVYAKYVAHESALRTGVDFIGHLPYSGDKVSLMQKLNNYFPCDILIDGLINHLKKDIKIRKDYLNDTNSSHIFLVSGHGGNSFIQDNIEKISERVGISVKYIPPLVGLSFNHQERGLITPCHAGDCEHSIGLYLNCFNIDGFKALNVESAINPKKVLAQFPVLNSLSGFMIEKYFPGKEFEEFRIIRKGKERKTQEFIENAKKGQAIFASSEVGQYFTKGNIETVIREIEKCFDS